MRKAQPPGGAALDGYYGDKPLLGPLTLSIAGMSKRSSLLRLIGERPAALRESAGMGGTLFTLRGGVAMTPLERRFGQRKTTP